MAPMKLTRKQERFVEEYLIDPNAAQAAIRAGYSIKTARAIGHENLTKPEIAAAIEKARAECAERAKLTGDMVVDELRKIAFANMGDYMKSTPEGDPYVDFSTLTPDQTAALAEMTVDFVGGRGENARAVKRVKCKLHDKQAALVTLAGISASSIRRNASPRRSRSTSSSSELPFSPDWLALQRLKEHRAAIQAMSPEQLQKFRHQRSWSSGRPPPPRRGPTPKTRPDRWKTRRFTRIGRRRRTRLSQHSENYRSRARYSASRPWRPPRASASSRLTRSTTV